MELDKIKELAAPEYDRVDREIANALATESVPVGELFSHVGRYSGKRLRPVLILLAAKALGRVTEDHIKLGAVVELLHTATLVHDDVLDRASMRRRMETVNATHGDHVSVLLGDMIYARAFDLSLRLSTVTAAQTLAAVTQTICQGEIEQIFHRNDFDLAEEEYFRIIGAKTASLYDAACRLSAVYAGASGDAAAALGRYGYSLGVAFQIVDDCLDIVGEERIVGKSLGTDTEGGKMTLPLIRLATTLKAADRERLQSLFLAPDLPSKNRVIHDTFDLAGPIDYAYTVADRHIREALDALAILPASPYRDALSGAGEFVLVRRV